MRTALATLAVLATTGAVLAAPAAAQLPVGSGQFAPAACPKVPGVEAKMLRNARCGRLVVPERRDGQSARTISLSVATIPAENPSPRPDPIVWLAGGPGDDGLTEIPMALAGRLNRDRDVIFFSQRGTYSARPKLTCDNVDRFGARTLDEPFDAPSTGRAFARVSAACRRQLAARGVDLGAYNTSESAADLEDLRLALAIPQWNLYGISYGTDYSLTYLRLYPHGIRSVGIDGVFPPSLAGGVAAWTSAGEGINALFDACKAQRRCRARYGDIGATFRRLVREYERRPRTFAVRVPGIRGKVDVTISGGMLVQWTVSPGTHTARQVPASLQALADGDPEPIATSWAAPRLNPAGVGILGNGLFYGVSCSEWVPYEDEAGVIAAGRRAFPGFPTSVLRNAPNLQFMRTNCAAWNVPPAPPSIRELPTSSVPTLTINAQYDGQTAPSFGPYVARSLSNATSVTIPNVAHVAFGSPSPKANRCAWRIATDFFDDLNRVDTSCAARVPPTDFVITPR